MFQSRLEALTQLQQLLSMTPSSSSDVSTATTLLSSAHHQLLVGCFRFGLLDGSGGQLCHYQVWLTVCTVQRQRIALQT